MLEAQLVNRVEKQRPAQGKLELAGQGSIGRTSRRAGHGAVLRLKLRTADKDERALSPRAQVQSVSHRFPPGAWRPGEEERPPVDRLASDRIAQGTDGCALAEERAVHAAAGLLQEILSDAQL